MIRLLLLAVAFALLCTSCVRISAEPDPEVSAYSSAFISWYYRSFPISQGIAELEGREDLPAAERRERLQELALRQSTFDQEFALAQPTDRWRQAFMRTRQAMQAYDRFAAGLDYALPVSSLIPQLQKERAALLELAITCYTRPSACS